MDIRSLFLAIGLSGGFLYGEAVAQRKLADGVLNVIAPEIDIRDTHSRPMPLPGLVAEQYVPEVFPESETLYSTTRQVTFFRDVYQYEFAFLPLRQMELESVTPQGQPRKVNVWYLVYRIRDVVLPLVTPKTRIRSSVTLIRNSISSRPNLMKTSYQVDSSATLFSMAGFRTQIPECIPLSSTRTKSIPKPWP